MAKKKRQNVESKSSSPPAGNIPGMAGKPWMYALAGYSFIAFALTFPLIFRMNSSVYGFYDHITTDMFSNIHFYFWSIKRAIFDNGASPLHTTMFAAPFGTRMNLVNLTGFVHLPLTALFGHLFSRNASILFNLIVSGMGMFFLVRHVTKNALASFIAGLVFAFCPNMLVRSYTTFDSTQVQWIPFYTLAVLKYIENRTWKNAMIAGVFLPVSYTHLTLPTN